MLDREIEYRKMAQVESAHWWYRALHERVAGALAAAFGARRDVRVLDAGCGTGGLLSFLRRRGYEAGEGFDLSEHAVAFAAAQGHRVERADLRAAPATRRAAGQRFDAIVFNDVNYFVPLAEWPALLDAYAALLRPGGIVIMNIPALRVFRGMHDRAVGIGYRLRREDVGALHEARRYACLEARYSLFLLSPLVFGARLAQRRALRRNPEAPIVSDVALPPRGANALLYAVMRLEGLLGSWMPWGSSLFVVLARR